MHGDHIFGLPGLLGSRSFLSGTDPLTIYGPKGIRTFVETSLNVSQTHLKYDLKIEEFNDGMKWEDESMTIEVKLLDHIIPSYGFRIKEKDKPGPLLVDKLKEAGIAPGPIYKQIKEGKTFRLDDGTLIDGKKFLGPAKKGRIITILGDTTCDNVCNWLRMPICSFMRQL